MCMDCIKMSTDITQGIPREGVVHFCRGCEVSLCCIHSNGSDFCNPPTLGSMRNLKVENSSHCVSRNSAVSTKSVSSTLALSGQNLIHAESKSNSPFKKKHSHRPSSNKPLNANSSSLTSNAPTVQRRIPSILGEPWSKYVKRFLTSARFYTSNNSS